MDFSCTWLTERRGKKEPEEGQPSRTAWDWTGLKERRLRKAHDEEVLPSKTAWDWLQLLIVPVILAAIAVAYNAAQTSREDKREDRRIREDRALGRAERQDAALLSYLTQEGALVLRRQLSSTGSNPSAKRFTHTLTLVTVHRLNGARKAEVVQFLVDHGLLGHDDPVVDVHSADLRRLILINAHLQNTSFQGANLRDAQFDGAHLKNVDFSDGDLRRASFRGASLDGVDFSNAKLNGAVFDHATIDPPDRGLITGTRRVTTFFGACLTATTFISTHFAATDFQAVQGHHVIFSRAYGLADVKTDLAALTDVRGDRLRARWSRVARGGAKPTGECSPLIGLSSPG